MLVTNLVCPLQENMVIHAIWQYTVILRTLRKWSQRLPILFLLWLCAVWRLGGVYRTAFLRLLAPPDVHAGL